MKGKIVTLFLVVCFILLAFSPLISSSDSLNTSKTTGKQTPLNDLVAPYLRLENEPYLRDVYKKIVNRKQNLVLGRQTIVEENIDCNTKTGGGVADTPWPMFCHDVKHTALSPYSTKDNPYDEIWRLKTGAGQIVLTDKDMMYTLSGSSLHCRYMNGTINWTCKPGGSISHCVPSIGSDGTIYFGTFTDGRIHAIYPNGTKKWTLITKACMSSSPAIAEDGTIYMTTMDGYQAPLRFSLLAINPNGTLQWQYKTGGDVTSSPAIADDGTIIFGGLDSFIYAIYPNGTLRWRYDTGGWVGGSPSIDEQGHIYINSRDEYLYALYPNGTLKWRTNIKEFWKCSTNPAIGPDGTIYVASDGVAAINPDDGGVNWVYKFGGGFRCITSPIVSADGTIYQQGSQTYGGSGTIYAIASNGTLIWKKVISNGFMDCEPCIAPDGTLYVCTSWNLAGALHAFGRWTGTNHHPQAPQIYAEDLYYTQPGNVELTITGIDEDFHAMKFIIDWGDGDSKETMEITSNYTYSTRHQYLFPILYTIRVKAIDSFGLESEWAEFPIKIEQFAPWEVWLGLILNFIFGLFD